MTFLRIVDFDLGGSDKKETELNLCIIYSVSSFTVSGLFFFDSQLRKTRVHNYLYQSNC